MYGEVETYPSLLIFETHHSFFFLFFFFFFCTYHAFVDMFPKSCPFRTSLHSVSQETHSSHMRNDFHTVINNGPISGRSNQTFAALFLPFHTQVLPRSSKHDATKSWIKGTTNPNHSKSKSFHLLCVGQITIENTTPRGAL